MQSSISFFITFIILVSITGCGTTTSKLDSVQPINVSGEKDWTQIKPGMTKEEFLTGMAKNGHPVYGYREFVNLAPAPEMQGVEVTYTYPYSEHHFWNDAGALRLKSAPIEASCTYSPDSGGVYSSTFPLTKARTKALFANSSAPLGFIVGESFPDNVEKRSWWTLRTWPTNIEEMLSARFEEVSDGTKVVLNTDSDQLVLKGRDPSFARSILEHMHCTLALLEIERVETINSNTSTPISIEAGQQVTLSNHKVLSSAHAAAGDVVEFLVAESITKDGQTLIHKGAAAMGEIIEYDRGNASIRIRTTKAQASNGQWYNLTLEENPLILKPSTGPTIWPEKSSKPNVRSSHIVYQIGSIVTATIGQPL